MINMKEKGLNMIKVLKIMKVIFMKENIMELGFNFLMGKKLKKHILKMDIHYQNVMAFYMIIILKFILENY